MLAGACLGLVKASPRRRKGQEQHTGSQSDAIGSPGATVAAHLLEASRVPPGAGAVVVGVRAHVEGVRAASHALDLVVAGLAMSASNAAMGIGPVGTVTAGKDGLRVHPSARLVDVVVVPDAAIPHVVGGPDAVAVLGPGESASGSKGKDGRENESGKLHIEWWE